MKKINKTLKIIFGFILLFIIPLFFLYFLIGTEKGSYTSLYLINKISPNKFAFNTLQGNLLSGLKINHINFNSNKYTILINNTKIKINTINLLKLKSLLNFDINNIELKPIQPNSPFLKQGLILSAHGDFLISPTIIQTDLELISSHYVLHLQGSGNKNKFILNTLPSSSGVTEQKAPLNIIDISKNINLTATIKNTPFFNWQANLQGENFNPQSVFPSPSSEGNINFELIGLGDNKSSVVQLQSLSGQLQNKKIAGTMHIAQNSNNFNLNSKLQWGDAVLFLQGGATEKWDLKWKLLFPNINILLINSKGKIESQGSIYGQRSSPHVTMEARANDLMFNDYKIEKLSTHINTDLEEKGIFQVILNSENLSYKNYYFSSFTLNGSGNTSQHEIKSQLKNDQNSLALHVKGGYLNKTWQEKILSLDILGPQSENWHLKKLTTLSVSPKRVYIEPFTLQSPSSRITGQLDWNNAQGYTARFKLQGNNFSISQKPGLLLYISPDLTANIKNKQININGKIFVPKAHLQSVKTPPSQVKLPGDVVFVDKNIIKKNQVPEKKQGIKINSKIQIILGNEVDFNVEGFSGKLIGHLESRDDPLSSTSFNGKLQVINGSYTIYGQTLNITQGWLSFINSSIDNPIIHIRAVKKFNTSDSTEAENLQSQVTVGLSIDGDLKKPQTTLFSDPPGKTQKDILSLLLFERTSTELSSSDNNLGLLLKAATSMDFGGPNNNLTQLIHQLQHGFGLSEFGIKSETTFNESSSNPTHQNTSFVLGKSISPRLYLKYSIGLLDAINTFTIRYLLGEKVTLQGQTNQQGSGIDLIYIIQK